MDPNTLSGWMTGQFYDHLMAQVARQVVFHVYLPFVGGIVLLMLAALVISKWTSS